MQSITLPILIGFILLFLLLFNDNSISCSNMSIVDKPEPPQNDAVQVGGRPLTDDYRQLRNDEFSVISFTFFSEYNPNQAYYDIALLELDHYASATPICLWTRPNLYVNNVVAIGYGLTEFAGKKSPKLMKVNLTVFHETYCQPFFKRQRKFRNGLAHAHICAGVTNATKDTCQGDSGGPLIVEHRDLMYAVGITSEGQGCYGFPPGIYTKISSYIDWINKVLSEHGYTLKEECP